MKAFPTCLGVFAVPALATGLASDAFVYDRTSLLQGEWWRLWTGHWVHFSSSHLGWNLAVLLGAGTWLERLRRGLLLRIALIGAPVISLGLLAFAPAMVRYGGLSGLATGVVLLLALAQMEARPAERVWWLAVLALTAGKTVFDVFSTVPLFGRFDGAVRVSALAHVLGAVFAALCWLAHKRSDSAPVTGRSIGPIGFIN